MYVHKRPWGALQLLHLSQLRTLCLWRTCQWGMCSGPCVAGTNFMACLHLSLTWFLQGTFLYISLTPELVTFLFGPSLGVERTILESFRSLKWWFCPYWSFQKHFTTLISDQNISMRCWKSVTICLCLTAKHTWKSVSTCLFSAVCYDICKWHQLQTIFHCATNIRYISVVTTKKMLEVIRNSPAKLCSLVYLQGFLPKSPSLNHGSQVG